MVHFGYRFTLLPRQGDPRWRAVSEVKYYGDGCLIRHVNFDYRGPLDVVEVYSPPRITNEATKYGLKPGEAFDLGTGWNFNLAEDRREAEAYIIAKEPLLVIGSPQCTMFSALQNLSTWTTTKQQRLEEAPPPLARSENLEGALTKTPRNEAPSCAS